MMIRIGIAALALLFWSAVAQAQEAPFVPYKVGSEYTMKRIGTDGAMRVDTYRVDREETLRGRRYTVIARDNVEAWLSAETKSIAFLTQDGKVIETYDPDWQDWQWPLAVGKSWTSNYKQTNLQQAFPPAQAKWTVTAYEDVTVSAGTFKAFRIERAPGANTNQVITRWYAPQVGLVVRQIETRVDQPGSIIQELMSAK